ncbi:hypothetical protein [Facklamia lactis]|uniref:hypothetical protein n=1 Tax=Facklamia lactis TaxID=2749967 RepID=UPI0018CD89D3|nr:hypothetical protein [Facklamia lactis]MBG9979439.1 hypothetical protein [Facklamia lactis]
MFNFKENVSYRNIQKFSEKYIVNSNIILEIASNQARNKCEEKFSKVKLEQSLIDIRDLTTESPDVFYPKLKQILFDCGIVLVGLSAINYNFIINY